MSFGNWLYPSRRRQFFCAASTSLKTMASAVRFDRHPLTRSRRPPSSRPSNEGSWLNQFEHVIVGHGISLLQWRSGGLKHLHDMLPSRFPPSPTSVDSSIGFTDYLRTPQFPNYG